MKKIVVLTGAGISAESGLATFRASDGLWEGHKIEDVATPEAYMRDPYLVNQFYNLRRKQLQDVQPNAAHFALADLAKLWDGEVMIITQNVDDLHERAGANVLHMHGELLKARCTQTGKTIDWHEDILPDTISPFAQNASLRPHIVWFGEMPFLMPEIDRALAQCNLFISIGTSGNVYPAAGFVEIARRAGAKCVELNLEPSLVANRFHESINGKATDIVPQLVEKLLS